MLREAGTDAARVEGGAAELYLDLVKRSLVGLLAEREYQPPEPSAPWRRRALRLLSDLLDRRGIQLLRSVPIDVERRLVGLDWPPQAVSMVGMRRLDNLQECVTDVIRRGVPGDLIETGVWRGGATILMRAVLKAYGDTARTVWVADSFEGLPPPDAERYPADAGDRHHTFDALAVSVEEVRRNFAIYQLLDEQVRFLQGWFRDTLPVAPISQLAVMRLDGDMYESTMQALTGLYPKLSVGGYVIVDDYGAVPACRSAVHDFLAGQGVRADLREVDWTGVYWRREE